MKLFLGDMISPIDCELIDHEELQTKDKKNKKEFCGLYIAEENKIKMPSFFAYMIWSICILFPLFFIITLIIF